MPPFRGRGASRGAVRGRGRGRGGRGGRGGSRGGPRGLKREFQAARIEEPAADGEPDDALLSEPGPESDLSDQYSSNEDDDGGGDDEEPQPTTKAYQALLQSYQANAARDEPRRKRRKMHHDTLPTSADRDEDVDAQSHEGEHVEPEDAGDGNAGDPDEATLASDEEEPEDQSPFDVHFASPDEKDLELRLKAIKENHWAMKKWDTPSAGKCVLQTPGPEAKMPSRRKLQGTQDVGLKPRLVSNASRLLGDFDDLEQAVGQSMFEYQDLMFAGRTPQNATRLRHMFCLHALNHILRTRDRVLKNNAKLSTAADDEAEYRDQGFTRPKILFLLETKQACVRAIESITQLYDFEQQENKKRFLDSFSLPEDKFSDDRPDDFRELFEGNDENEFRIGIKLTRKTLKFYSTFYNSDIIFASALGMRRAIESGDKKKKDCDFLSSIEVVVVEQADATLMQNWEHAEYVFEHLNLQPKDAHGCDFSRVRSWYLDGHATHIRQTIVLSAYLTPKINTLYNKHMRNVAGRLRYTPDYTAGIIESLSYGIKQTFSRFDSPSWLSDPDARFKYFNTALIAQINRLPKPPQGGVGVLVFIPSYLDFVRVRNSLVDSNLAYASISEYTDATDVRKARSHFMSGRHSVLLYTGRAHHFHRYNIRGVRRVIFYGVPENPRFYDEVVGFVGKSLERGEITRQEASIRVAFSKWERLELERIVGSKRVSRMVAEKGDVFDFV